MLQSHGLLGNDTNPAKPARPDVLSHHPTVHVAGRPRAKILEVMDTNFTPITNTTVFQKDQREETHL